MTQATPDPADKAAFVDTFQPVANRRAGYSTDAFARAMRCARNGGTLAANEGLQIIEHFEEILYTLTVALDCKHPCRNDGIQKEFCPCWKEVREMSPG